MAETLRKVIQLRPDRIACYNYAHLPERFSSQRAIDRLTLPEPHEKLILHQIISDTLQEAGYLHIGMDHFVLPQDELAMAQVEGRLQRNFQGYSLQLAEDLLGLGVSSISQLGDFYLQNERQLDNYYSRLDKGEVPLAKGCRMNQDDRLRKHIIMSLICELQLDITECNQQFGVNFNSLFAQQLLDMQLMERDGIVAIQPQRIVVTENGRPFLRNICMLFDAYLSTSATQSQPGFSKTV